MSDLVGQNISRYHIVEQLGRGGMATVYKAYDTRLEREVAFKVIRRESVGTEYAGQMLKRFEREGKVLARLSHPNIVSIHDYGEHDGSPYLVMEYIRGGTLSSRLNHKPVPYQESAAILAPIARALEYAHKQKLIHRDVKPSNILIDEEGRPMLSDFGIAKILETDDTAALTGTGVGIGTPEYMAPEQSLGKDVDHRADVYALGIIFFELLTGRKPFQAETPMAVVIKHINDPLPRPKSLVPTMPDEVEAAVFRALAKRPEDRYQDMGQFAAILEKMAHEAPTAFQNFSQSDATVTRTASQLPLPPQPSQSIKPIQVNIPDARTGATAGTYAPRTPATGVSAPYIDAPPRKGPGWLLWAGIGGGVLLLGLCVVIIFAYVIASPGTATATPEQIAIEEPTATEEIVEEEPTVVPSPTNPEPTKAPPPTPTIKVAPTWTDIPQATEVGSFPPGMNITANDKAACSNLFYGDDLLAQVVSPDPFYCDTFDVVANWATGGDTVASGTYKTTVSGGRFNAYLKANQDFIYYQRLKGATGNKLSYVMSIDARRVDGATDSGFGILFRYDPNNGDYYLFEVADTWKTYIVLMYKDSKWTTLEKHTSSTAIRPDDWNRITVFAQGSTYDIYINGYLAYSMQDSSLSANGVGFAAEVYYEGTEANFEFDNFIYIVQ